jgi:hypothetical protein
MNIDGVTITGGWTMSSLPTITPTVEYLVVAGGGGAGGGFSGGGGGGGGGAGGYRTATGFSVPASSAITVTVGPGGAGGSNVGATRGTNGSDSGISYINSYSNSYSFNGTTQYLSVGTNAAFAMGTSDFTAEAWIYPVAMGGYHSIISTRPTSSTGAQTDVWVLGVNNTGFLYVYSGAFQAQSAAGLISNNAWYHVAVSRQSGSMKLFINGIVVATTSSNENYTASILTVGANNNGSEPWPGNISNLRLVKGVAVYTGNFTVPTSPLTATQSAGTNISAITGVQTSLLTLQSATIIDNSTYAFSITNNNGVAFSSSNPFTIVTSVGGGAGACRTSGAAGGSGGGGGGGNGSNVSGTGIVGQGKSGGASPASGDSSGGGGGASAVGATAATGNTGGNGGAGTASSISGSSVTYAGGGGGGGGGAGGAGGAGGGGAGATGAGSGTAGTVNTGGGGGGGGNNQSGATGGSGIVIIRYSDIYPLATSTTGTPTITTAGGYRIYRWTSSGSITL